MLCSISEQIASRQKYSVSMVQTVNPTDEKISKEKIIKPFYIAANQPNVQTKQSQNFNDVIYHPEVLFQGAIQKSIQLAKNHNQVVTLSSGMNSLVFVPATREVFYNTHDQILRALCVGQWPISIEISEKHQSTLKTICALKAKQLKVEKMDSFLWKISLWTSKGKLSNPRALNCPVYLSRLPLFVQLEDLPKAQEIASELHKAPINLLQLAKKLRIHQKYIFAFYSAAEAIGIAGLARRQVDKLFVAEAPQQNNFIDKARNLLPQLLIHKNNAKLKSSTIWSNKIA